MKTKYHSACFGWLISALILFIASCSSDGQNREARILFTQYRVQGQVLYNQHCSNCHQIDGTGLRKLIPPLAESDFLMKEESQVICGIKHGMNIPIAVKGENYHFRMPAHETLTNLEIAEILTYIKNEWGNNSNEIVSVEKVEQVLKECAN